MPDDVNRFNTDNLTPDWMRGEASDDDSAAQPARAAAPGQAPPWEQFEDAPNLPADAPHTPAPWQQLQQTGPLPPDTPSEPPPWERLGGADAVDDLRATLPDDSLSWDFVDDQDETDDDFAFETDDDEAAVDWGARLGGQPAAEDDGEVEVPPGFTGMLPWRQAGDAPEVEQEPAPAAHVDDDAFSMDDLMAEFDAEEEQAPPKPAAPSLRDRLLAMSPSRSGTGELPDEPAAEDNAADLSALFDEAETSEMAETPDWMGAFGEAAATDDAAIPQDDESDLGWLTAAEAPAQPAPVPEPGPAGTLPDWFGEAAAGELPDLAPSMPADEPDDEDAWPVGEDDELFFAMEDADLSDQPVDEAEPVPAPSFEHLPDPDELLFSLDDDDRDDRDDRDDDDDRQDDFAFDFDDDEADDDFDDEDDLDDEGMPWLEADALGEIPALEADEQAEEPGALPSWLQQPAKPPTGELPKTGIRRIAQQPEEPEPAEEPDRPPDWLDEASGFGDEAPAEMDGLTYDEWAIREEERLAEEQKSPEERLLEEVPDWFDKLEEEAPPDEPAPEPDAPRKPSEAEFVPDWFLGLEEQDVEQAPDWFQKLDLTADALTEPAAPTPAPRDSLEPDEEELPDWFKGADAPELAGTDWAAMFGGPSEPPSEPPKPPGTALAGEFPDDEDDIPLPDLSRLPGGPDEGPVPEWLAEAEARAGEMDAMLAEPDEVPFPDLDLDQPMPQADDSGEDFVERFDPLMPDEYAAPRATPAPVDEEAPDWLREMAHDVAGQPEDEEFLGEDIPLPDDFGAPVSVDAEDLDWLHDLSEADAVPAPDRVLPPDHLALSDDALDSGDIDDLLGLSDEGRDLPAARPEMTPAPLDMGAIESEDELAALFEGLDAEQPEDESAAPAGDEEPAGERLPGMADIEEFALDEAEAPESIQPPAVAGVQPEWVEQMRPADLPVTLKVGGVEVSIQQKKAEELSDRLRAFRDATLRELSQVSEPMPTAPSEALEGITNALPVYGAVMQYSSTPTVEGVVVSDQQRSRAQKLQQLLELVAAEEEEADEPIREPGYLGFETEPDEEAEPVLTPVKRRRRKRRFKLDRVLIGLLMLAALLAPFATDALHFADDPAALGDDGEAVAAAIAALAPNDYVLVAFEYGPTAARELDPLADAVLRDILTRGAIPLAISTNPMSTLHADYVLNTLANDPALLAVRQPAAPVSEPEPVSPLRLPATAERQTAAAAPTLALDGRSLLGFSTVTALNTLSTVSAWLQPPPEPTPAAPVPAPDLAPLQAGRDYVVLAYLPGNAVGVRSLRSVSRDDQGNLRLHPAFDYDARGDESGLAVGSVDDDIALIVVIGEESADVRTWSEQLNGSPVPKVALVSAAIEPLTTPYVHDDAYAGYLAGYRDAVSYNAAHNAGARSPYTLPDNLDIELPNPEESRWHSMALGAAAAAGLIALGMLFNLLRGMRRRSRR